MKPYAPATIWAIVQTMFRTSPGPMRRPNEPFLEGVWWICLTVELTHLGSGIPSNQQNNPRLPPMLDAFVIRLLRRHVGVCHVAAPQHNVNRFVIKRTRSPSRRRRWGCLRTPTAPARTHGPGRRAAGRAEARARVTAPSTMVAMMPQ